MRSRKRLGLACVIAVAGLAVSAPGALGDPPGAPSCVGSGSSALAPGQGGQFAAPGARADVSHVVKSAGGPPGQTISDAAHAHGTAQECFPEGPPTG
jgi:hypothetical protein